MRLKSFLLCVVVFLVVPFCQAQGAVEILCRVIDLQNKYPVSYATIQFNNSTTGVIANEEGSFRLPGDFKTSKASIKISSIGYETKDVNVGTLSYKKINIIYLKPKVEALSTVVIEARSKNARPQMSVENIIRSAIGRIPTNYPDSPHSYISYYRDYQMVNNSYFNVNEAIIENFDAGFGTNKLRFKDNQTAMYSYKLNNDFYRDTLLLNTIYGKSKVLDPSNKAKLGTDIRNELEILNIHNPIRNFKTSSFSFIYVLRDNFLLNHNFKLVKVQYIEDTPLYEIDLFSKEDPSYKYRGVGKIFVSKDNFAIHKLEYRLVPNSSYIKNGSRPGSLGNRTNKNNNEALFEVTIEYKEIANEMYLNYMTFNNKFIIQEPNPLKVEDFNFNPKDEAFYITFNKPIDEASLKRKSNFKLRYKRKKLIVKEVSLADPKTIKIETINWSAGLADDTSQALPEDFSYKLKRIKDVSGGEIGKANDMVGYQFRELFTQEVFQNKKPPEDLIFVIKELPMSATKVNTAQFDLKKYWINTPLKQTEAQ